MNVFNNLPWHDATLESIFIDRRNPGIIDTIDLVIRWPHENSDVKVSFSDCYALRLNINFGIIASESILNAVCMTTSEELKLVCEKWKAIKLENIYHYRIETNSTGGVIDIFAKKYYLNR